MAEVDLSGIDPAFHPRLKLFFSADIIGSTAYKQPLDILRDDPRKHGRWAGIIQGFYKTVKEVFAEHWQTAANRLLVKPGQATKDTHLGPPPRFWKTIGDEVVFWKELTNSTQVWLAIACWMKTIESLRDYFDQVADDPGSSLDVKSAVWMAGFPVRNKVILDISSSRAPIKVLSDALRAFYAGNESVDADFIGPGIDVGFRVTGLASARKMSISLDVAYALAKTQSDIMDLHLDPAEYFPGKAGSTRSEFVDRLRVYYSGSEPLKGVLGGIRYPKFWISVLARDSLEAARVALYTEDHGQKVDWVRLQSFCDHFYNDRRKFVARPFIVGDKNLNDVPPNLRNFLVAADPRSFRTVDDLSAMAI
jgi:hypothetical protein